MFISLRESTDEVGYIQRNKPNLKYQLGYSSQHNSGNFNAAKAILYTGNDYDDQRFSTMANDPNAFWSICLENPVYVRYYKFQEINFAANTGHQKHWKFYGCNDGINWIEVDEKNNMVLHNAPNYIGKYKLKQIFLFRCFKFSSLETWDSTYPHSLTFRNFDIFDTKYINASCKRDSLYLIQKFLISFIIS